MGKGFKWYEPRGAYMEIPNDDSDYGQGFADGCRTGMGSVGDGMLRFYGLRYDVNRGIENNEYYAGYHQGISTCTYYISPGVN